MLVSHKVNFTKISLIYKTKQDTSFKVTELENREVVARGKGWKWVGVEGARHCEGTVP